MSTPERVRGAVDQARTQGPPVCSGEHEEDLPLLAKMLNHILTPGSSLTPSMWIAFNIIIFILFLCWLMFVYAMPTNIHVWVFGFLGFGFAASTNWFMKVVFSSGLDFASQQKEKEAHAAEGEKTVDEKKRD